MYPFAKFKIYTPKGIYNIFTTECFYKSMASTPFVHLHHKTEFHIVTGDTSTFLVNNKPIVVPANSVIVIPENTLHYCIEKGENAHHYPFQTDYPLHKLEVFQLEQEMTQLLSSHINSCKQSKNMSIISSWISLMISKIDKQSRIDLEKINDLGFLIDRFFTEKYSENVTLNDLCAILNFSPRQTERYVINHTGMTFGKKLNETRIRMAKELMKDPNLTLVKIASMVGYKSYAGFWRALKKFEQNNP